MKSSKILFALLLSFLSINAFAKSQIVCGGSYDNGVNGAVRDLNKILGGSEYDNKNVSAPTMALTGKDTVTHLESGLACVTVSDK